MLVPQLNQVGFVVAGDGDIVVGVGVVKVFVASKCGRYVPG